eukprot:XP_001698855.1 predicted protein [Chlamydomonas reinhardtii]
MQEVLLATLRIQQLFIEAQSSCSTKTANLLEAARAAELSLRSLATLCSRCGDGSAWLLSEQHELLAVLAIILASRASACGPQPQSLTDAVLLTARYAAPRPNSVSLHTDITCALARLVAARDGSAVHTAAAAALVAEWASLSPVWAAQARSCGMISAICQSILARRQRNQGPAPLPGVQLHLLRALLGLLRRDAGAPEAPAGLAQRDAATAAASITEVLLCSAAAAARAGEGADGTLAWGGAAATPLAASRASAAAAVGITSSTEELVLALSCAAALAACQAQAHMGWADSPRDLPPVDALGVVAACGVDVPDRSSRSSGCQPPVVLPLVPLLGAIAASYLEAAEAALRRLNRRLSRPFTAQQQHQHDRHVCKPSVQASSEPSGDGGGGTCSSSGCGSSMCSGGASTWSSSSEGSSSAPNDYADCRKGGHSAAAGGAWKVAHARPWPGEPPHQPSSLSSGSGGGSSSVAHSAVALLHNLAAPPSETHRLHLRRTGILGPLLAYLGSALSPDATASPAQLPADLAAVEMALRVVGRLSGSTGHSGGGTVEDGAGARELQCPHLRAAAKLSSLQRRLQSLQWDEPQACGHAGAKSRASQQRRTCLALIDDLLRRAAATPEAVAVGAGTASDGMTFQSDLLVGGRPVQVLSVVQRHEDRASDGSVHVRYTFEDRVVPGPVCRPAR